MTTRPVSISGAALGLAVLLLSGGMSSSPASATPADDPIPGLTLPVPATDVSDTDRDLGSTAREVVVVVDRAGAPQVTKLRARSGAAAETLAQDLDALPGVTAALNTSFRVPTEPASRTEADGAAAPSASALASATQVRASAWTIAGEPLGSQQWGLTAVGAEGAWALTRGRGVTVAVVDTGVDATHPDLTARTLPQVDLVGDGATGDPEGHGTHVAGIVGATMDGAGVVGLANEVRILPVRVLNAQGNGDTYTVARGILAAADAGAGVINLSLGAESGDQALAAAVATAVSRGITVVASGGNGRATGNLPNYPASYPGVLGVASVDSAGQSSWFSTTGSAIDLAAPGEDILSTVPGGGWALMSGTSMAAPFVAGAAALVRAANPALNATQIARTLERTARDDDTVKGRDDSFGYGVVQADAATRAAATADGGILATPRTVAVRVARSGYGNVLRVDVDPDRGAASYLFHVQKRTGTGAWTTLPGARRTQGAHETASVTLGPGVYRVRVAASTGYRAATSPAVRLTAPTARVTARPDASRNRLIVDVDPDRGSGSWTFVVLKRASDGTWRQRATSYRTQGRHETRTVNLSKGTYRVVVRPEHGYAGVTSRPVTLVR